MVVESQAVGRRKQAQGSSMPADPTGLTEDTGSVLALLGFDALCIVAFCLTIRMCGDCIKRVASNNDKVIMGLELVTKVEYIIVSSFAFFIIIHQHFACDF